ncbi:hypothetical protein E4P36_12600 [Streptomyces sp. 4R-3d]|nr:hypothetical protein E4P36_12600 [Streptomyces sp. 4R-3d]
MVQVSTSSDHSCVHMPMHEQMHVHGGCSLDYRLANVLPHSLRRTESPFGASVSGTRPELADAVRGGRPGSLARSWN